MNKIVLIFLLAAFPAVSTDMYLPAIPTLQAMWGITLAQANLSLVAFFAAFSFCLLIHGPLSDRYGRRPVLIWGIALYIAGSYLCAASVSISMLVAARVIQAAGAAAASALSFALTKDLYTGAERQKILAYIGVIIPLCPMVAPMLGGWLMEAMSWRWIFVLQGTFAFIAFFGCLRMSEPLVEFTSGGFGSMLSRYARLAANKRYMTYMVSFSAMGISFMGYIAGSADIYIKGFGVPADTYGLYFGFNALALMLGSLLCSRLVVGISSSRILAASLVGLVASAGPMLMVGGQSANSFALCMFATSFFLGVSRPVGNHMILEQVDSDVGAASSFMTFTYFIFGALGMELVSLAWLETPLMISILTLAGSLLPLGALLIMAVTGGGQRRGPELDPVEVGSRVKR